MPRWIHNRAEHLLAKNPNMNKSTAFAIATQQSHALGKSPKDYGTSEGRSEAKSKYDTPKDDKKKANPGQLESPKMASDLESKIRNALGEDVVSPIQRAGKAVAEDVGMIRDKIHDEVQAMGKHPAPGAYIANRAFNSLPPKVQGIVPEDLRAKLSSISYNSFLKELEKSAISPSAAKIIGGAGLGGLAGAAYGGAGERGAASTLAGGLAGAASGAALGYGAPRILTAHKAGLGVKDTAQALKQDATAQGRALLKSFRQPQQVNPASQQAYRQAETAAAKKVVEAADPSMTPTIMESKIRESGLRQQALREQHGIQPGIGEGRRTRALERKHRIAQSEIPTNQVNVTPYQPASQAATRAVGPAKVAFSYSSFGGNQAQNPPGKRETSYIPPFRAPALAKKAEDGILKKMFRAPTEEETRHFYEDTKHENKQYALGTGAVGGVVAPLVLVPKGLERVTGSQVLHHGTSRPAAEKIRVEGLDPLKGGTGSAGVSDLTKGLFEAGAKNRVFVSSDPWEANMFARITSSGDPGLGQLFKYGPGDGERVRLAIPYEQFKKNFEIDPDTGMGFSDTAFRSKQRGVGVGAEHVGQKGENYFRTLARGIPKNWAGYAKSHPGRVGAGALMLAAVPASLAGAGLAGKEMVQEHKDYEALLEKRKENKKEAGVGVGAGMSASSYSGTLSYGPFKMTSGIPGFRRPAMERSAPSSGEELLEPWMLGLDKSGSAPASSSAMTPAGRLVNSQRVGTPKTTGFSGPSIADVSKPIGFGTKLPGTIKNGI